jgi:chemotaxis protein MotA
LCYGLVGPLSANMAKAVEDEHAYYQVLRVTIVAFMKGTAPTLAVEIGRRAIPGRVRPAFQEAEMYIKEKGAAPVAVAA